jgi:hypothetical protein
VKSSKNFRGD